MALTALVAATGARTQSTAQSASPQVDAAAAAVGLEEIVVTAQRRSENLQRVPITVSAIVGDAAVRIGINGTESFRIATPALGFSRQSGNGDVPFLRGVSTSQGAAGTKAPVAVYVDDVYIGTPAANVLNFNNIERVEVLKGPQGTLFGRNATGGVIQIRTKRPSQTPAADIRVGYGNYDTVEGSAYLTGGLTDQLADNVSAQGHKQYYGFGCNVTTGE